MRQELLYLNWISKAYGNHSVLKYINLNLFKGELLAVVGHNAVGKSTLLKIISGYTAPDSGSIYLHEQKITLKNHFDALALGIYSIQSSIEIVPEMSVFENIYIGLTETRGSGPFFIKKTSWRKVEGMIEKLNLPISPGKLGYQLSPLEKYYIEILRAKLNNTCLLLIDEPFITLNNTESEQLKKLLLSLKREGISIIFTSHKISDVHELADRICVLKSGKSSVIFENDRNYSQLHRDLITLLTNQQTSVRMASSPPKDESREIFRVEHFSVPPYINDVTFSLYEKEILGITGLESQVLTELTDALWGLGPHSGGTFFLEETPVMIGNPRQALKHKIAYMSDVESEHPQIIPSISVLDNLTLPFLKRLFPRGFLRSNTETYIAEEFRDFLPPTEHKWKERTENLSYGMAKKLALARWFSLKHKVLILNEPLKGLDMDSRIQVITHLHKLTQNGTAIIVKSMDFDDIACCATRALVFGNGNIRGSLDGDEITADNLLILALQNHKEENSCTD